MGTGAKHVYRFGAFRLDATNRLLYCRGELVALPPKALDTLLLLVQNNGRVLSKAEMIEHLWPDTFVEEGTLTQYIFLLRKALRESASWIENHPRRGYRFTAPVEEHEGEVAEPRIEEPAPTCTAVREEGKAAPRIPRFRMVVASLVILATVTGAALIRVQKKHSVGGLVDSVAVLPFRTAFNSESDHLADGITDALITKLSNVGGLRVVSYSRVRQFKNSSKDAAALGRQLGVQAVIEGTVRVRSGQMRVSVHAIDTETANTLWADDRFAASSTALPDVERQVSEAIALRLKRRVTPVERDLIKKSGTRDAEAYDLALRARAAIQDEHWEPAEHMLRRAVQLDPVFADAHGWLAFALTKRGFYGGVGNRHSGARGHSTLHRADGGGVGDGQAGSRRQSGLRRDRSGCPRLLQNRTDRTRYSAI